MISSGRSDLLLMDPCAVQNRYLVCGAHFSESSFTNANRNRLKCNAVPTQHLSPILTDSLINEYNLNLIKWKGDVYLS